MKIAVSKGSGSPKYFLYAQWLKNIDPSVEVVDLAVSDYNIRVARSLLETCAGLIFTGGSDIDPRLYHHPEYIEFCHTIDRARDDFELELFSIAREQCIPILGICRGAQLINVALGGSLIADIPSQLPSGIEHGKVNSTDSSHSIEINAGTLLGRMLRRWDGYINSAHHQAVEILGRQLHVASQAQDGVIEAIELSSPESSFLLGVQWHPERMEDLNSPFSKGIGEHFLFECRCYAHLLKGRSYHRDEFFGTNIGGEG